MNEELLSALRYELGEVTGWEELCPGVYSLTVQPDSDSVSPCGEYYLRQKSFPRNALRTSPAAVLCLWCRSIVSYCSL